MQFHAVSTQHQQGLLLPHVSQPCVQACFDQRCPAPAPALLQEHLRGEALKTNELLRHFWPCMPPLSTHRVELAVKLAAALQKQHAHLTAFMRQDQGEAAGWAGAGGSRAWAAHGLPQCGVTLQGLRY
jgi:hypothetical protein